MLNVIMMLFTLTTGHIVSIASSNGKGKPTIIPTCPIFRSTSMTNLSAEYFENIISFELCTCNVGTYHDHETNTCKRCPVGQPCVRDRRLNAPACDGTNSICSCPAGQLVSTVNNLCTSCAAGKFQPFSNVYSASCHECPKGQYDNANDRASCNDCIAGNYADETGLVVCKSCARGQHQSNTGMNTCEKCARGRASAVLASTATECTGCTPGYFADQLGLTACKECEAGYYSPHPQDNRFCQGALPGYTSNQAKSGALKCGAGKYSNEIGLPECLPCNPGMYGPPESQGLHLCLKASRGYYVPSSGATSQIACTPGHYSDINGSVICKRCVPGRSNKHYYSPHPCEKCLPGEEAPYPMAHKCDACLAGKYSPEPGGNPDCIVCPAGRIGPLDRGINCTLTLPGYTSNQARTQNVPCNPGSFAAHKGSTECTACPSGFTAHISATKVCSHCSPGRASNLVGSATQLCPACVAGRFANDIGFSECLLCADGQFSEITGAPECMLSSLGHTPKEPFRNTQIPCTLGSYSDERGLQVCKACDAGTFADTLGRLNCSNCPTGRSSTGTGNSECAACQPGKYTFTVASKFCKKCDVGMYATHTSNTNCTKCRPGSFAKDKGSVSCNNCQQGRYSNEFGTANCKMCKRGQSASHAYITCVSCQGGYAAPEEGMIECQACAPGSYANGTGNPTCTLCLPGKTNGFHHAQNCRACTKGKAQPERGSSGQYCPDCKVGFYADKNGMKSCQSCGINHYNDFVRQDKCLPCLAMKVSYGFDRPDQCGITWIITFVFLGCFLCCCSFCCWAKLGFPSLCCCCKKKNKFKQRNSKLRKKFSNASQSSHSMASQPNDWEFCRGTHSSENVQKRRMEMKRKGTIIEIPNQIPSMIPISRVERGLSQQHGGRLPKIKDEIGDDKDVVWGEVNPMMKSVEKSLSGA
jgi:hypothetical protein